MTHPQEARLSKVPVKLFGLELKYSNQNLTRSTACVTIPHYISGAKSFEELYLFLSKKTESQARELRRSDGNGKC